MRVLVTGGAGYIGPHIVRALQSRGHTVAVVDDLSTGHRDHLERLGVAWTEGDLRDTAVVDRAFTEHSPEAVVHVAGKALAPESVVDPGPYFHVNTVAGLHLLDAMRRHDVRRIVFSSTCAVYGQPQTLPIREDTPKAPISPYGESKLAFEYALHAYAHAHGIRRLALRYFNVAGASDEFGERHDPETHLIPNLLRAALRGDTFKLFGTDYPTRDGTCIRDYIHVVDLARAHALAIERLDDLDLDALGGALNLGTGTGASVREVLAAVEDATGGTFVTQEEPRRPGDPPELVADASRAQRELGFTCEHDLRSMVRSAHAFHQAHPA